MLDGQLLGYVGQLSAAGQKQAISAVRQPWPN